DRNSSEYDLWILETSTKQLTRFTVNKNVSDSGAWSWDGTKIAYNGNGTLFVKSVNGGEPEKKIFQDNQDFHIFSWSPDGKLIFYNRQNPAGDADIYSVSVAGNEKPVSILATTNDEQEPELSPDGKWIAYRSDATGLPEIYVCPYPGCNRQWKISTGGAIFEFWKKDGSELYYQFQNRVMVVTVKAGNEFQFASPRLLFTLPPNTYLDV